MRTGRELDRNMAGCKINVETGYDRMNEIASLSAKRELFGELELLGSNGVEIDLEDKARISNAGFQLNGVDQGFGECAIFERREIEAVDIVPNLVIV